MSEAMEAAGQLRNQLSRFLKLNTEAGVEAVESESSSAEFVVTRPWGDESIELRLRPDDDDLIKALNAVRLVPRFTAIWHEDRQELEVIYSALPVDPEVVGRSFEFRFRDTAYSCSFESASRSLLMIAHASRPLGPSDTDHRNLRSFYMYVHSQDEHPDSDYATLGMPTSFWIRGLSEFDENQIIDIVRNLNFHMSVFDRRTPTIAVHESPADLELPSRQDRYYSGEFPDTINAHDIDQHLLSLWESARSGDTFLRFLHYYQILEYAAFYYVRDEVMQVIQRVLTAPDTPARPRAATQQILEAIAGDRTQGEAKIGAVIKNCVEPQELWAELDAHRSAFSVDVTFDGGFTLAPVIGPATTLAEFRQSWHQGFPQALHRIRNALVHARESRQSTMIAPTRSNHDRLFPWLEPLSLTAARVMLYGNTPLR